MKAVPSEAQLEWNVPTASLHADSYSRLIEPKIFWTFLFPNFEYNGNMLPSIRQAILLACILSSSLYAIQVRGNEATLIGKVLTSPSSYHLQTITLQGTIHQPRLLTPNWEFNRECYAATFSLVDETGTIDVLVLGLCGNPTLNPAPVLPYGDGDHVMVEARIQAPGYYTGEGLPPGGETREATQAIAIKVRPVPERGK